MVKDLRVIIPSTQIISKLNDCLIPIFNRSKNIELHNKCHHKLISVLLSKMSKVESLKAEQAIMKFTEAQLEEAFIELLGQEDIPHVLGGDIARSEEEVLIKEDLKAFLLNQYKSDKLTESEAESNHSSD